MSTISNYGNFFLPSDDLDAAKGILQKQARARHQV